MITAKHRDNHAVDNTVDKKKIKTSSLFEKNCVYLQI